MIFFWFLLFFISLPLCVINIFYFRVLNIFYHTHVRWLCQQKKLTVFWHIFPVFCSISHFKRILHSHFKLTIKLRFHCVLFLRFFRKNMIQRITHNKKQMRKGSFYEPKKRSVWPFSRWRPHSKKKSPVRIFTGRSCRENRPCTEIPVSYTHLDVYKRQLHTYGDMK